MLKDIEISTKSVKQLKNYLILASRLLAMTFLIFAFAQPFIPSKLANQIDSNEGIVIYIDNSFSMSEGGNGNSYLDLAKKSALSLLNGFSDGPVFNLLTNNFKQSEFNRMTKAEITAEIEKLDVSSQSKSASEIFTRIKGIKGSEEGRNLRSFWFSDFQISQFGNFEGINDSSIHIQLIKIESGQTTNISIDSCWSKNPISSIEGLDSITVQMTNYSDNEVKNHPLRLYVNDRQVSINSIDLQAWESKTLTLPSETGNFGLFNCYFETIDEGINQDDRLYYSYQLDSSIQVYHIGGDRDNKFFKALYSPPFNYQWDNEGNTDISSISSSNVFILNAQLEYSAGLLSEIEKRLQDGATLVLYQEDALNYNQSNELFSSFKLETIEHVDTASLDISKLNTNSSILLKAIEKMPSNPNYPQTKAHFKLNNKTGIQKEDILNLENGESALRRYQRGKGWIYVFNFPFDRSYSNFTQHALFVPIFLNLAFESNHLDAFYHSIGKNDAIAFDSKNEGNEAIFHITGKDIDVIPEVVNNLGKSYLFVHDQINEAGNYQLVGANNSNSYLSFNYLRRESDVRRYNDEALKSILGNTTLSHDILTTNTGAFSALSSLSERSKILWKYCIILALMFFIAEVMILKFMKT